MKEAVVDIHLQCSTVDKQSMKQQAVIWSSIREAIPGLRAEYADCAGQKYQLVKVLLLISFLITKVNFFSSSQYQNGFPYIHKVKSVKQGEPDIEFTYLSFLDESENKRFMYLAEDKTTEEKVCSIFIKLFLPNIMTNPPL